MKTITRTGLLHSPLTIDVKGGSGLVTLPSASLCPGQIKLAAWPDSAQSPGYAVTKLIEAVNQTVATLRNQPELKNKNPNLKDSRTYPYFSHL